MIELPNNVIHVDFGKEDDQTFSDMFDYYRKLNGTLVEVAFSEDEGYYILGLVVPGAEELFIVDCGWSD